jgi:hypothetical protein
MKKKNSQLFDEFADEFAKGMGQTSIEYEKEKDKPPKYDIKPMKEGTSGFIQPDDDGIKP